jgi:predicted  nucleic acid-binding Zn-ribbon protein
VEEELNHRRAERSAAEDAVLAAMERAEAAPAAVTAAQARLDEVERARAQRVPALKAEGRDAVARVRQLQEQRSALTAAIPGPLLARYEGLRAGSPPAVAAVHGGACGACGVTIPTALRQRLAADELLQCINCNRLLVEG